MPAVPHADVVRDSPKKTDGDVVPLGVPIEELVIVPNAASSSSAPLDFITAQIAEQSERIKLLEQSLRSLRMEVAGIKFCPLEQGANHDHEAAHNGSVKSAVKEAVSNAAGCKTVPLQEAPLASVALDLSGDGHADVVVTGVDQNRDGIPDEYEKIDQNGGTSSASHGLHGLSLHNLELNELLTRTDFESELAHELKESLWDASLFIGTEYLSLGASLVLAFCLLLNVGLVSIFALISEDSLLLSEINEESVEQFQLWRRTVAHDVSLRNPLTGSSLASGVCNQELSLPASALQVEIVEMLSKYLALPAQYLDNFTAGSKMCSLALCIWYLTLAYELRDIASVMSVVMQLPHSPKTVVEQKEHHRHAAKLKSISCSRRVFMFSIFILRLAVVVILFWYGTVFLIHTLSISEMLLNAVSLDLILSLDELIFLALVPRVPQDMIHRIVPIKYHPSSLVWSTYLETPVVLCMVLGVFASVYVGFLSPFVDVLQQNFDALCGGAPGSLDFVVAVDALGIPWAAAAPSADEQESFQSFAEYAVAQRQKDGSRQVSLQPKQRSNLGSFMQVASPIELDGFKMNLKEFKSPKEWDVYDPGNLAEVIGWDELLVLGDDGYDYGDAENTVYNQYLKYLLLQHNYIADESSDVNCSVVPTSWCNKHGSTSHDIIMRQLCPSRCGCASPLTGTISNPYGRSSNYGFIGCALYNIKRKSFIDTLKDLPCVDTSTPSEFLTWSIGFGDAVFSDGANVSLLRDLALVAFETGGCSAVAKLDIGAGLQAKLCEESSLPALCPESCGCNTSAPYHFTHTYRLHYCPHSCQRSKPACLTIKGDHNASSAGFGPKAGYPCIFPFVYEDTTYTSCTSKDWVGPWCAITLKDGFLNHWGDCPPGC